MKKSNVFTKVKEVVNNLLLILALACIVIFPLLFLWFVMWAQTIIFG